MYLCRADGASPIYVFSLPQRLSHYPLAKLLCQYYKRFKQVLHFCYNNVFLMVVFTDNQTVKSNSPSPSGEDRWGLIFNTY